MAIGNQQQALLECDCCGSLYCADCCGTHPLTDVTLTIELQNATAMCACWDGVEVTLIYQGFITNELGECEPEWVGVVDDPCDPDGTEVQFRYYCRDNNSSTSDLEIGSRAKGGGGPFTNGHFDTLEHHAGSCDPWTTTWKTQVVNTIDCGDGTAEDDPPLLHFIITE